MGVVSTGIGVGGFAMSPFIGIYLIPAFGWRASYLGLAVITWVLMIPLALLVLKTRPSDKGLYPDGVSAEEVEIIPQAPSSPGLSLDEARTTSAFWLIAAAYFLSMIGAVGVVQSQVPHLSDIGFPVALAATALGSLGLLSAIGKIVFGWLCDRASAKYASIIGICLQLVGLTILFNITAQSSPMAIWFFVLFMGLGIGSWLPTMSILTSTHFGLFSFSLSVSESVHSLLLMIF